MRDNEGKIVRGYVDFHLDGPLSTAISDLTVRRDSADAGAVIAVPTRRLPRALKERMRLRQSAPVTVDDPAGLDTLTALIEGSGQFYVNLTTSSATMRGQAKPLAEAPLETASADGLWKEADETSSLLKPRTAAASPRSYRTFQLDRSALASLLGRVPMQSTDSAGTSGVTIAMPLPDGQFSRFRIEESPVMEPALAAKFPDFKTYRGQGIDDPAATARFDWTPDGFHAIVLFPEETVFVNPAAPGDTEHYDSYYKADARANQIHLFGPGSDILPAPAGSPSRGAPPAQPPFGATLRTYRLAVAVTRGYTANAFYGGGDGVAARNATLTKLGTIVNLINALYERDLAVHFNLIAGELSAIFDTTSNPDPGYTDGNTNAMLNQNQGFLDTAVGAANYDIGHALGLTGTAGSASGLAQLSVVCGTSKANAVTLVGAGLVTGDFIVDAQVIEHEVAHQFSANHTTNSTSAFCAVEREAATAYEPGSGSTILANASSCAPENLQQSTDNYFHSITIDEIDDYVLGAGACFVGSATGNTIPTISAGSNAIIPIGTPFALTATAADADGDTLTYAWEEFDLGAASPPLTDDGTRPLFRTFFPNPSPSRSFPSLRYILNNANQPPATIPCPDDATSTCIPGEVLPATNRTMNYRVTVRDNRAGGGAVNKSTVQITSTTGAGPFQVTQPNTAVTWPGLSSQSVTWAVAGTTAAPVSTANVKISLSTDGGNTFPTVLAASTPNNGTATVSIPNTPSATARIKVEAVGNIFFDISDLNFTISGPAQVPTTITTNPNTTPQSAAVGTPFAQNLSVTVRDAGNAVVPNVSVTFTAPATGASGTFAAPGTGNTAVVTTDPQGVATAPQFTANIYAGAYAVTAAVGNLNTSFNLTNTATGGPPTADSVTNFSAGNFNQTLTLQASSPNGAAFLQYVAVMLSAPLLGSNQCSVVYDRETNKFYLWTDGTTPIQGPLAPGANASLTNAECTFNAAGSSVSLLGNQLTVSNVNIVLKVPYGSSQNVYLYANDNSNQSSGWVQKGTTAPSPLAPPTADSVTGGVAVSLNQTLTLKYSSLNGYLWLNNVYAAIGPVLSASNSCVVFYDRVSNALYLYNDAGSAVSAALAPGSGGSVQNSQCTLAGTGSSVSGSVNTLTMVLKLTFSASFGGGQNIFMYAYDRNGLASGWQQNGSTISNAPPTADSFSGFVGGTANQTLTFTYSSVNGGNYIQNTYVLINGAFSAANGCIVLWNRPVGAFYLMNDAGTAFMGPLTATNLSNAQCTLKFTGTQTAMPGTALNMTLNLTFNPVFTGVKQVWMDAFDAAGNTSNWVNNGTITLP